MTTAEAVDFIRPAVPAEPSAWADLGAGAGVFTEALAFLLGAHGRVFAVERDPAALVQLEALARSRAGSAAAVTVVSGDLQVLGSIPALAGVMLGGALLANVLHFFPDPSRLLRSTAALLATGGRIVVVEYGGAARNRWVPYPVPLEALKGLARVQGLADPRVVSERPSRYQRGALYCAVLEANADATFPRKRE